MADSDSEAFESADEEVEDKKQQKKGEKTCVSIKSENLYFFVKF